MVSPGVSSHTALTAAAARAAHLLVDSPPHVFADTVAERALADRADELLAYHRLHGDHPVLAGARAQTVVRARCAEDRLAAAVERGTRQYVVLGAGLDTFAHRSPYGRELRVFEVDHPATQTAKRAVLGDAVGLTYVPVDLEAVGGDPVEALTAHGFEVGAPAFVSWLGVTMYLTPAAVAGTLRRLGTLVPGSELVVDYLLPEGERDADGQAYVDQVAPVSAEHGEPWLSFFSRVALSRTLRAAGFSHDVHLTQREALPEPLWRRSDALRPSQLAVVAHARL